jgi:hypothetical protein
MSTTQTLLWVNVAARGMAIENVLHLRGQPMTLPIIPFQVRGSAWRAGRRRPARADRTARVPRVVARHGRFHRRAGLVRWRRPVRHRWGIDRQPASAHEHEQKRAGLMRPGVAPTLLHDNGPQHGGWGVDRGPAGRQTAPAVLSFAGSKSGRTPPCWVAAPLDQPKARDCKGVRVRPPVSSYGGFLQKAQVNGGSKVVA